MSYLLDTNVISESTRPQPDLGVVRFLQQEDLFISAVTLYEIYEGVLDLDYGKRKLRLRAWFDRLRTQWQQSILPIDEAVAVAWAELVQRLKNKNRTMAVEDVLVAATASAHRLTIATRNLKHFEHAGVDLHNPFEADLKR